MGEKAIIKSARRTIAWEFSDGRMYDLVSGRKGISTKDYIKSGWAYACMDVRGTELANIPWKLTRNDEIVEDHILIDMIKQFGVESNYSDAMRATEIDMLMFGAAYWLYDVDILKRLNPQTMKVKKTASGISGFEQTIDGKVVNVFDRDEIIYFREYNPDDDLGAGISTMDVLKTAIDTEYSAACFITAHFENDAIPGLALVTDQVVPEPEMERVQNWWQRRFGGVKNAGKVAVMGRGLTPAKIADNMKESAVCELRDQARTDICTAMRVSKVLVGNMQAATYVNLGESRKFLIENVIVPRAKQYAATINQDLIQKIDPTLVFEFDPTQMPILQEDTDSKHIRLKEAFEDGLISAEFYREQMGYEEESAPKEKPEVLTQEDQTMRSWQKKALKALKRDESPDVEFDTEDISKAKQDYLHAQLAQCDTEYAVKAVFID